ncbi:hypothetical protein DDO73_15170 [Vibrio cholerae]|nr:hypothetical protein [Vibrio cholerae]
MNVCQVRALIEVEVIRFELAESNEAKIAPSYGSLSEFDSIQEGLWIMCSGKYKELLNMDSPKLSNLVQNLFENAYFPNHTLLCVDTKQVSGEPVHTVYIPIDLKDKETDEVFTSAVSVTKNSESQVWEVKCPQIANTLKLGKDWTSECFEE